MRRRRSALPLVLALGSADAFAEQPAPPAEAPSPAPASAPPGRATAPDEVIVVTGLRLPRPLHDLPAAATVIEREQLERTPGVLADDLVRAVPAVGTFRRSSSAIADPTSQGLNLRGLGPSGVSRALVLRDGVPVNDPFGGWVYWRAMSSLGIDRVEVVPSGASALFGNFALGGVLQVISRRIEGRAIDAVVAGGSLGTQRFAARATETTGDLGFALDAEALHASGYAPITASQRGTVDGDAPSSHGAGGARVEYRHGEHAVHAQIRGFSESLDAGTAHTTADVRTATYEAGWDYASRDGTFTVQLFGGTQRFAQERARVSADRATAASASTQRTPSNNQGLAATWTGQVAGTHAVVVGADAQRVAGTSTDALTPPTVGPTTLVTRAAGGEQRFAGVFVQDAMQLTSDLELVTAIRLDGWQNLDASRTLTLGDGSASTMPLAGSSRLQVDPRIGALFHVTREVAVRASAYRAFRAPTLNELYRSFQAGTVLTAANEQLRPETLWGGELGLQIAISGLSAQASGFWNQLRDPIANVTLPTPVDGATRQRENLGSARIAGLDLDVWWHPAEPWTLRVGHMFSDARVTSGPAQPELVGKRLAQDPRNRTVASVSFDRAQVATVMGQVRYLGSQYEDDLNTLPIGAVILVDARIERALWHGLAVFASGQNLFDRRYVVGRAGIDTEGAPRTLELGLAYRAGAR